MRTHASSRIGETSLQNREIRFLQRQCGDYAITPLHHYAITPVRPLRHYTSTAIMAVRQYGHYASTPVRPLCQYASMAIMPVCQYGHYAITPHSLASVKDMYVEMGFPLNLYRQNFSTLCRSVGLNQMG